MPRPKGTPKTGGRVAGTPNKFTGELKGMILEALANKGGVAYLEAQADINPNAFLGLVGKVLPLQVSGPNDGPILTRVIHEESSDA